MARTYWTQISTTQADGVSLDAHVTRTAQDNAECVLEETRCDWSVIRPYAEDVSTGWYGGPYIVPMRLDRTGRWRSIGIDPLCSGGLARTLRAWLTERYYQPSSLDPGASWSVASGTTAAWQGAEIITPPRDFTPGVARHPNGDESGAVRMAWLWFDWANAAGTPAAQWCGVRIYEVVDD